MKEVASRKFDTAYRAFLIDYWADVGLPLHFLYCFSDPYFPAEFFMPAEKIKAAGKTNPGAALWTACRILSAFRVVRKQLNAKLPLRPEYFDDDCQQCGKCCTELMPMLLAEDIDRWRQNPEYTWIAELWASGPGGFWADYQGLAQDPFADRLPFCPFLLQYPEDSSRAFCSIHSVKPWNCRGFGLDEALKCAEAGQIGCREVFARRPEIKAKFKRKRLPLNDPWRLPEAANEAVAEQRQNILRNYPAEAE